MSDVQTQVAPFDLQGDLPKDDRVKNAMRGFVREFSVTAGLHMESCIKCGLCADACHFYVTTNDPKYTPIHKLKVFRDSYIREMSPYAPFFRLFHLKPKLSFDDLKEWEALIFDACTMCGRCTLACPMGIDIAELIKEARFGMYKAGLLPNRLAKLTCNTERRGSPFGTEQQFLDTIQEIEKDYNVKLPVNLQRADVLVTLAPSDLETHRKSVVATAKILDAMGISWTMHSKGFEATNFGYLSGNLQLQEELTRNLIDAAVSVGAHTLLLPECGHAYGAARWEADRWYGEQVPVEVLHIVEFMARALEDERIKVKKVGGTVTFHDPCQLTRRGGLEQAPRSIMKALGLNLIELENHGSFAYCCGGGGGVLANERAEPLRLKVFDLKRREVEDTGAKRFVTSCGQCRMTFEKGAEHFNWDRQIESLLEVVADNMIS